MANTPFRVSDGQLKKLVDMLDGTYSERMTDKSEESLLSGLRFRSYWRLSIAQGSSFVVKFNPTKDFVLTEQVIAIDEGKLEFTVKVNDPSAPLTETAPFNTPLPVIGVNRMSVAPIVASETTINSGGTFTGGLERDYSRIVAATSTAQEATVGPVDIGERGLPGLPFYLTFTNVGTGSVTGSYRLSWQKYVP